MLPFFGNKNVPTVSGRPSQPATVRSIASRRELHLVFLGFLGVLALVAWFIRGRAFVDATRTGDIGVITAVAPMRAPLVAQLPALPSQADVEAQIPELDETLADGNRPSLTFGLSGAVLAWGERLDRADRERPPLPQRVSGEDLARRMVVPGGIAVVRGRLADAAPAPIAGRPQGFRWLSLALDHDQVLLALAPDDGHEFVLNDQVQVLGRYLGLVDAPVEGGGTQATPLLFARVATPVVEQEETGMKEFQGAVRVPDDVFAGVDDERPLLETRAYYYTVGQVKTEAALPYAEPVDANRLANDFHQRPGDFRGKACRVRGLVHSVWQDDQVADDRPFDVRRVTRVLMYRRDVGPITENGVTKTKSVLRLFELAIVGDGPAPQVGQYIEADGRFLKWRAMRVDTHPWLDQARGVQRSSDKVYSMFFVVPSWRELPLDPVDWAPIKIGVSAIFGLIFLGILWYLNRDRGAEKRLRESVVQLRRARRKGGPRAGEPKPEPPAEAPPAPAVAPPADPPPPTA